MKPFIWLVLGQNYFPWVKKMLTLSLCLGLLSFPFTSLRAQQITQSLSGDLNLRAYYNDVDGNQGNSFLTEGPGTLTDLYFYYNNTSPDTNSLQWDGLLYVQGTDDPRYEINGDKIRIRNGHIRVHRQNHFMSTAGYFSENLTEYTFLSSLLGSNSWYQLTDSLRLQAFGGRANRAEAQERFRRWSAGGQLTITPTDDHSVSLSYNRTWDEASSLKGSETIDVTSDTITNTVRSIRYDGRLQAYNLQLDAELASSDYETEPASGVSADKGQQAKKADLSWRPVESSRFRGHYEKVDNGFRTVSGFAQTNQERYLFGWDQQLLSSLSFLSQYETWEDGLEGNKENDVDQWSVESHYTPREPNAVWQKELTLFYENIENQGDTPGIGNDANDRDESISEARLWNRIGRNEVTVNYLLNELTTDNVEIRVLDLSYHRRFDKLLPIPITYEANGIYTTDEEDTAGSPLIDRTVEINNRLILAEGRREEIEFYHRYNNEDPNDGTEIVRNTMGGRYRYILSREYNSQLNVSLRYLEHVDEGDHTQDYEEKSVELQYKTPF